MSGMNIGTKKGDTRFGPLVRKIEHCSSNVAIPPMPLPIRTPVRSSEGNPSTSPAPSTASLAAAIA
jgi:hypothetical protein